MKLRVALLVVCCAACGALSTPPAGPEAADLRDEAARISAQVPQIDPALRDAYLSIAADVRAMDFERLLASVPAEWTLQRDGGPILGREQFAAMLRGFRARLVRVERTRYDFERVETVAGLTVVTFVETNVFVVRGADGRLARRCTHGREQAAWRRTVGGWRAVRSVQTQLPPVECPALPAE